MSPSPPDQWSPAIVVTKGMTPDQFVAQLNAAAKAGYTGPAVAVVPSPLQNGESWVSVGGYSSSLKNA